jgi:hypothetical protein
MQVLVSPNTDTEPSFTAYEKEIIKWHENIRHA